MIELLDWHPVSEGVPYDKVVLWWTESGNVFQDFLYDTAGPDVKAFLAGSAASGPVTHWADIRGPLSVPTVYVVLWKDRHADTTAHVFKNSDEAIEWAWLKALECCSEKYPEDFEISDYREQPGEFVYGFRYSCEDDCLDVSEKILDGDLAEGDS